MLSKLMTEARARFDQTSDEGIARLHDGLAELREAVARHDQDLSSASMDEDDGEPL